ncbi:unnamed protein product [Didymodactylos carnosus]|uniref:Aspartate racemase n=1 Tax=Didymodactylos carnosus TaxID=1234261 RepID=A0A813ZRW7_9BILA|nr:unnamed protein product [Didymodactylos carnosus]CAF3685222.1 unnamed protein product [Didymodactylos carnosus]
MLNMKHIGIVDITTVGACLCANEIVAQAAEQDSSGKHPEFTMHAFSFDQYKDLVDRKDWDNLAKKICESIKVLQNAGADFIIIPSNSPHFSISQIIENSQLHVVNLIEVVVDECSRNGYSKVLVLGTKLTMQGGLYKQPLQSKNILSAIPNDEMCDKIEHLIRNELIPSKINSSTVQNIQEYIQNYDCDAVILGCTELPVVYNKENLGKDVIDTTRLLAHYALRFSKGELVSNDLSNN